MITVLNYSGGKQSTCLLWMVLRGHIETPENFLVLNADPGMENSLTYEQNALMRAECASAGIEFHTVPGPNLYEDLLQLGTAKRIDNPPYWTAGRDGRVGQLMQKCTRQYKVAPMDRFLRLWLQERLGYHPKSGRLPVGLVEKWIGFCRGEEIRVKPSQVKYISFRYPLLEMGMGPAEIATYYEENGLKIPPRSVCNACFANGPEMYRIMRRDRPHDFAQAMAVDAAVRDMTSCGVEEDVFVSKTLRPIGEIAAEQYDGEQMELFSCDSGYCFT